MDGRLYKKFDDNLLDINKKDLNRQNMITGAMSIGFCISNLISTLNPEMADVCSRFSFFFASSTLTSLMISSVIRYYIAKEDEEVKIITNNPIAEQEDNVKKAVLTSAFKSKAVETLEKSAYPEIYFQADALKEYIQTINFEGAENLVKLLDSLMYQLQEPMDLKRLEYYEEVIGKIADMSYIRALKFYSLPYEEKNEYDLDELVLKAKVLECYLKGIAYPGYESDLNFLYQSIDECKLGSITPENFNQWIHYIANRAYQNTLNEGVTR